MSDAATLDPVSAAHREREPESFDLMFRMLAGHDRAHLAQARRALATVRGRPPS